MKKTIIQLLTLCTFFSCASPPNPNAFDDQTHPGFELERFMGDWYVIAHIPTVFEKKAVNAIETYKLISEHKIDVVFSYQNEDSARKRTIEQTAEVINTKTNSYWKIALLPFLKFDYLVLDVAEDYSWCLIGVPSKDYVWIMARSPELKGPLLAQLKSKLAQSGYDMSKLRMVPQGVEFKR